MIVGERTLLCLAEKRGLRGRSLGVILRAVERDLLFKPFALFLALTADVALACSCAGPPPPPCEFVEFVKNVFLATATEVSGQGIHVARLRVDQVFRGTLPDAVEMVDDPLCSPIQFEVGHQYLLYQSGDATKRMFTVPCSRESDVRFVQDDLSYLWDYVAGRAVTQIRGNLDRDLDRFARDYKEHSKARPMKNVSVLITGNGREYRIKTNGSGDYKLSGVAPGGYRIQISKPGFTREELSVSIPTQGCAVRNFKLTADRRVDGTIRDERGNPLAGVEVSMKLSNKDLEFAEQQYLSMVTEADGTFAFDGVWPGTYHLGINLLSDPYYYPGTPDRQLAKEIVFTKKTGIYEANFVVPVAQQR